MDRKGLLAYDSDRLKILKDSGYYISDEVESDDGMIEGEPLEDEKNGYYKVDLLQQKMIGNYCELSPKQKCVFVSGEGDDMQVYFPKFSLTEKNQAIRISFDIYVEEACFVTIYFATDEGYTQDNCLSIYAEEGYGTYDVECNSFTNIRGIRFDPSQVEQDVVIYSLNFEYLDLKKAKSSVKKLYSLGSVELNQEGNVFTADVDNYTDSEKMLCIPIIYSDKWEMYLDGSAVKAENINGGLLGLLVPAGKHKITFSYNNNYSEYGRMMGLVSFLLYIFTLLIILLVKKLKNRPKKE